MTNNIRLPHTSTKRCEKFRKSLQNMMGPANKKGFDFFLRIALKIPVYLKYRTDFLGRELSLIIIVEDIFVSSLKSV